MKTTMILRGVALAVCAFAALSGTAHAADDTLYRQFGEQAGLTRIVDDLYDNVLADPRTAPYFENAPIKRIKTKLVEQFCVLLSGPCEYTGRPMRRTHEGQNIDRAAFNALVEDLQAAMDKNGVPFRAQNKLLAKLAPMYRDVQDRE
ncbi:MULTISPECIES: group 1 truncated hemoglobin [unclassified Caballeronia]|uniref:group I truncated hemoglobin n=1 Tax=unclassified Caballeronia TaxID=2646786 RepID=UPI0015899032|nr:MULTISPECIES: group 1 truncated hemoglobin [unclassified Caballeronia]QSN64961.1 group 1 truncated hemoglobin [Caballeronia sp. M1242]